MPGHIPADFFSAAHVLAHLTQKDALVLEGWEGSKFPSSAKPVRRNPDSHTIFTMRHGNALQAPAS